MIQFCHSIIKSPPHTGRRCLSPTWQLSRDVQWIKIKLYLLIRNNYNWPKSLKNVLEYIQTLRQTTFTQNFLHFLMYSNKFSYFFDYYCNDCSSFFSFIVSNASFTCIHVLVHSCYVCEGFHLWLSAYTTVQAGGRRKRMQASIHQYYNMEVTPTSLSTEQSRTQTSACVTSKFIGNIKITQVRILKI